MTTYLHSQALNMNIKHDDTTGITTVKDYKKFGSRGYVTYSAKEVNILKSLEGITPGIHLVKNIFDGEITGGRK